MIAFVVILVILDQISKFVATANLMEKSKYIVIKGLLSFNYLEGGNKGAAWGIFITQEINLPTFSQLYVYHVVKDIFHDVICS